MKPMRRAVVAVVAVAMWSCNSAPEDQVVSGASGALSSKTATVLEADAVVRGRSITEWGKQWWRWTFEVPFDRNPEVLLDADCAVSQHDGVFFVPAYDGATTYRRECTVPALKPVLVPLWVIINDFPCPDPDFHPGPGQTLEEFLTEGVVAFNDATRDLTVTVDGVAVDPSLHRHTTSIFEFTADPSLVGNLPDACLQGTRQPGVSDGWWLMLKAPIGRHEVHITAQAPTGSPVDFTYVLNVERRD